MRRCAEEAEPLHRFLKATALTPVVLCFFANPFLASVIALRVAPRLENVFSGVNRNAGITVIDTWLPVHPVPATHLELWSNADRIAVRYVRVNRQRYWLALVALPLN